MSRLLFSYGTLQLQRVQKETFGRILEGKADVLTGYRLDELAIKDEKVKVISEESIHPIAVRTGVKENQIKGMVYDITEEELAHVDKYEVSDYQRVFETLESGARAWVYVRNQDCSSE